MIAISKMVATRLHQPWRAILSVLNRCLMGKDSRWDTDEFEWKIVERSSRPSKMSKLLYTRFTKLIIDYILSHNKSIPCISNSKLHNSLDDQPITKLLNTNNGDYKFGMEVPDATISDAIQKKVRLESLRQKKKPVAGKGSSITHNKYYDSSDNDSDATLYYSSLDKIEESANETNDADEFDMDLSNDNPHGDNDAIISTVTSFSLDFIQTMQDETPTNELINFMSHAVYTDSQTTSVVHNPERNAKLTNYISGASEVPFATHINVLATKTLQAGNVPERDEFEWKIVERSSRPSKMSKLLYTRFTKLIIDYILSHNKSIPCISNSKLHNSLDDQPITKLLNTNNGDYKFGMEVPDATISDAIQKKVRLESLRQKKKPVAGKGSSITHNKYYDSSDNDSDATLYYSSLDKIEESANETNDADEFDMDLSNDNPHGDNDAIMYGVHA
nr:hypothetical protein [Tanacetum cinerariifolium]